MTSSVGSRTTSRSSLTSRHTNGHRRDRQEYIDSLAKTLNHKRGYILDVGCGRCKHPGSVGMDIQALKSPEGEDLVDVVWNWNDIPWPFPDESCITILASHVVEHISPIDGHFLRWMDECWRILKPNRQMAIALPYGLSSWFIQDPTHCNPCNERTWLYFDPKPEGFGYGANLWNCYEPKPWKIEQNMYHSDGFMEVVLRKRGEDPDSWQ